MPLPPPPPTKFIADERARFDKLSAQHPLLLLPVRIETRFDQSGKRLKIRIYPDAIHQDGHWTRPSADELALAKQYWTLRLAAADANAKLEVDRWLCERVPERRAAWLARVSKPTLDAQGKPVYPNLALRSESPPPVAAALPDHFAAVGWLDGARRFVAFGKPVKPRPALGPALGKPAWSQAPGVLPVDADSAWLIDYDQALAAGLAITVDLGQAGLEELPTRGLDTLLIVGVRYESAAQGAQTLGSLLEAHLGDQGLEFVAQGTPTNNTESANAGWTAEIDELGDHFARELGERAPSKDAESDALRLAAALGLSSDLLARVIGGERSEQRGAAAMQQLIWEVSWGAYLDDLLAPEGQASRVDAAIRTRARQWFVEHVRGGAALPTLAIGSQPYGILPIRRRLDFQPLSGDPATEPGFALGLERLLISLVGRWRESLALVPRLDPVEPAAVGSSDVDRDIATLLGSLPHPNRFVLRRLTVQRSLLMLLWGFMLESMKFNFPAVGNAYVAGLAKLTDIDAQISLLKSLRARTDKPVTAGLTLPPMIDALVGMLESHRSRLAPIADVYPGLLREIFDVGVQDVQLATSGYGNATADRLFTRPLIEAPGATTGARASDYLKWIRSKVPLEAVPLGSLGGKLGGTPAKPEPTPPEPTAALTDDPPLLYQLADKAITNLAPGLRSELRSALATLATCDADQLELRLRETLGLASHRIDAWFTSLAQRDLDVLRGKQAQGIQLGAWGFVESLRPDQAGARESEGFIHAPSLAHAATAAVLRAGWRAHAGDASEGKLAVDLRSSRVRLALDLVEGMRAGQQLGDLLGARFERILHDGNLDAWIDPCRKAALAGSVGPRGPVDGLALLELYEGAGVKLGADTLRDGTPAPAPLAGVQVALETLQASLDAVGDASIADAVHLLLQANDSRAAATLDAIAGGDAMPPELRSLESPRAAITITHRVALGFGPAAPTTTPAPWGAGPLATLEPALENWLAGLLPSPSAIKVRVIRRDGTQAGLLGLDAIVSASKLSLLTWLSLAPRGPIDADAAWARLAVLHARTSDAKLADERELSVDPDHAVDAAAITLADFALLAHALYALLTRARPLDARDLAGSDATPGWNLAEATARFTGFRNALVAASAVKPINSVAALRAGLLELADFGLPAAIPRSGSSVDERSDLDAQLKAVLAQLGDRLAADAALASQPPPDDDAGKLDRLRQRLALLLDQPIVFMPKLSAPNPAIASALTRSNALLANDPTRATNWLHDAAKVRPELGRLAEVIALTELTRDASVIVPVVGQIPDAANEPWVALAAPTTRERDRLCLWFAGADLNGKAPIAGLLIDEFNEALPAIDQTTGIALHFDSPSSRPPQTLLLAVPRLTNDVPEAWSFERLCDALIDTIELAKLRAVDPDILQGYGHHAPAIFPGLLDAGAQP
ncbi:hypothetical protein ACNOYE_22980 [Nannocystaceae bacterium ST9]